MRRWPLRHPLHLVLGLSLWFAWFCLVYGAVSVACAVAPPDPAQGHWTGLNAGLLLLTAATVAVMAGAAWACARAAKHAHGTGPDAARDRFLCVAAAGLYGTAAVSTAFVGLPLAWLPPCV
jgi:hypothetical protein